MNKNMITIILLCSMMFTSGCQPSDQAIQTALAQTQEALPTATKIALEEIDLQGILIQPGDLPSDYEAGQVKYDWPIDTGLPMNVRPSNFILQMFKEKGDSLNIPHFSMLALYNDSTNVRDSYVAIISTFDFQILNPPTVGDKNSIMHYQMGTDLLTLDATLLVFQRCNSLVVIRTFGWTDDDIFAYAKGLDKRVEKIACQ